MLQRIASVETIASEWHWPAVEIDAQRLRADGVPGCGNADDRSVVENVVFAVDLDHLVADIEVGWVVDVVLDQLGKMTSPPFGALYDDARVWQECNPPQWPKWRWLKTAKSSSAGSRSTPRRLSITSTPSGKPTSKTSAIEPIRSTPVWSSLWSPVPKTSDCPGRMDDELTRYQQAGGAACSLHEPGGVSRQQSAFEWYKAKGYVNPCPRRKLIAVSRTVGARPRV